MTRNGLALEGLDPAHTMHSRLPTLDAWLDWQAALHPKKIELGLERVARVWGRLGPSVLPFPVVTVGGTNGKGSCVAMMEAIVSAGGYRCACYTSPHLLRYNERVRIAGEPVSDDVLCEAFERVEVARGDVPLTYFEFGTLAALDIFISSRPDVTVLEVGLGGRLDAVNLLDADVSLVASIGFDHMGWLGDTLDEIAEEKAGIFRRGRPAVIGQREAPGRLREAAERVGAVPLQLGREYAREDAEVGWILETRDGTRLNLPAPAMRGTFQLDNAAAAVTALLALKDRLPLQMSAIRSGLQRARLPGRFQVVPGDPVWILDVAHNADSAVSLAVNLRGYACQGRLRAVLAVLSDKDPQAIVRPLLPFVDDWYLSQSDDARALPVSDLSERLSPILANEAAGAFGSLDDALDAAAHASGPGDCILVVGSFTTVGAAMRRLQATGRV